MKIFLFQPANYHIQEEFKKQLRQIKVHNHNKNKKDYTDTKD